jgi:hypothetical protein
VALARAAAARMANTQDIDFQDVFIRIMVTQDVVKREQIRGSVGPTPSLAANLITPYSNLV